MRSTIKEKVEGRIYYPHGGECPITVEFEYDENDPYRIGMVISTTEDTGNWEFSRDLLDAGLLGPAGLGDVRIWPEPVIDKVHIRLSTVVRRVESCATLVLPLRETELFLQQTYACCPSGAEALDLDLTIERILAEGAY